MENRKKTKTVNVGGIKIGGSEIVSVQSMTKTKTQDIDATVAQIRQLKAAGCDIVRSAVPDEEAALALKDIIPQINIPLVADIHFNYRLALIALEAGVNKIRINPGNIGKRERVEKVLKACKERNVPIRIGVNSGSIEKNILKKYGHPSAEGMVESALYHVAICEEFGFNDIVISLKATDVQMMIEAYRLISSKIDYPLHLGVTEAGPGNIGMIKSAVGIGTLLAEGIGDTIRVSLTSDPADEIKAGLEILKSLNMREAGIKLVSCPTCGRIQTNMIPIVNEVQERIQGINKNLVVAIMGCAVNGPGEAREADLGIACGKDEGLFFKKGESIGKVSSDKIVDRIMEEIEKFEE
ncbi:MAG: flavodoxin-dependent (E)-4-hydroxy-3-methylbut-2-enyl-diphosphate synthase [Calditrichia bacterium]|nr:flavodoxin-dependent (E)-4-hydroxy-3-methylbut-2-enyl-diphosphate synthase [Calditrichia bacterium]